MYIKDFRIDDFGCFQNARLEDLTADPVVIGGPQRAGKTTFMQALRQLPDGIDRGSDLPPATDQYRIDAEILHNGSRYRYLLSGHASPSVSPIDDGPAIDAEEIFGPVTERQYRNLYTISLDELRRLPPGIDDTEDLARVLLGGAYGDIADIPEIEDTFSDRANTIGLSKGDPDTKTSDLYGPYDKVREGIEARNEASQQVEEYNAVTEELFEKRSEKEEIEAEIARRQQQRNRLNILNEVYEPLQEIEALEAQLTDVDRDAVDEFPTHLTDRLAHFEDKFETVTTELTDAEQTFERDATVDTTEDYYEWLLEYEGDLDSFVELQNLWEKTIEDLREQKESITTEREELEREIDTLYSAWDSSFTHIDAIDTSSVDTARVAEVASTVKELETEHDDLEKEIETKRREKEELESELAGMEQKLDQTREVTVPKRKPAIVAGLAIIIGIGVGLAVTPVVGGIAGLATLGIGLYLTDSTITVDTGGPAEPYREVNGRLKTLKADIKGDLQRQRELKTKLADKQDELSTLVAELGLPDELPENKVSAFYKRVCELDKQITALRQKEDDWEAESEELADELEDVATLLTEVTTVPWTASEPLKNADTLLSTLETMAADLELAREVRDAESERADCIRDINSVLTEWEASRSTSPPDTDEEVLEAIHAFTTEADRVSDRRAAIEKREELQTQIETRLETPSAKEVFEPLRDDKDDSLINTVKTEAASYGDTDAIADEIRKQQARIEELESEQEQLRKACVELEQRQDELASEEDLQAAQAKIDEGRVEFERLGEAYAVNRIAEAMVDDLHERLLDDVVHSLADDASTIFSEITQEYEGIAFEGTFQDLEFQALRSDKPAHGVGELSRATAEQLFLAIRLARIRETDVSLPVVLDDAATNFDPNHLKRVFDVVDTLATTNQVFLLTCHPQCVRTTAVSGLSAQYWSLEDGRFTPRDTADTLEQQLSAD